MIRRLKRTVLDQLPPKRRQRVQIETTDNKVWGLCGAGVNGERVTE
jgi:hypothetical protein